MDTIVHIKDYDAFLSEMITNNLAVIENEITILKINHTPFIRNGIEALIYVRDPPTEMSSLTNADILGDYDTVLVPSPEKDIYDRIYPRTPVITYDVDNNEIPYTPPEKFGEFI